MIDTDVGRCRADPADDPRLDCPSLNTVRDASSSGATWSQAAQIWPGDARNYRCAERRRRVDKALCHR
jgi:hypothetical protein